MSDKVDVSFPLVVNGSGEVTTVRMVLSTAPQPEANFCGDVVVYADEQGTSSPNGGTDFAVGFEFGPAPIAKSTILDARNRRTCTGRRCRDKTKRERRPFFHACDDCDDCRGILASTIRHELRERFFMSLRWHFPDAKPDLPTNAKLHQYIIAMLLGSIANIGGVQRIIFKFERIRGLLKDALEEWLHEDIRYRIKAMVRLGILLSFVPVEVAVADKAEEPGIQVCDHLLWREYRQLLGKPESLLDVGMAFSHSYDHPPHKITAHHHVDFVFPRMDRLPEGREPGKILWDELQRMLYWIEVNVHQLARTTPPELQHLSTVFAEASLRTRGRPRISLEDFVEVHTAFLTVVGLYARQASVTSDQRQCIADLARLAITVSQLREGGVVSMLDAWAPVREHLIAAGDAQLT